MPDFQEKFLKFDGDFTEHENKFSAKFRDGTAHLSLTVHIQYAADAGNTVGQIQVGNDVCLAYFILTGLIE